MTIRTRGGKLWLKGGKLSTKASNLRAPTNADLGFVEASWTATTDQAAGTYLFTAQILNASIFTLQGYSFSNFRRTAGFSKLTGGTATDTTRPFTSSSMVLGDAASTSVTISVDFSGPTSGTISATIPGTIEAPPGTGIVVHQFTLHNTGGSTIKPRARLGLAFERAAFPDDFRLKVRDQATQADVDFAALAAWNTWADGSFRSTADGGLVMEDGNDLAAGSSRVYEVYAETGTQPTSGFDPFAWLAAHGNDLTVAVTARTGSTSGAMPDLAFSLKTAIATTTRREILCDTSRFVRIKAWQKVPQEEHLICEFHLDFWLDGSAVPVAIEFAAVLTQHWWVNSPFSTPQTKEMQTYSAVVKYGATTLDSRTGLQHAYHCRWASLRSADDAQHARKHWIDLGSTAIPTVRVQYSDASLKAMMRAGYIPPLRLGVAYSTDLYNKTTDATTGGMTSTYAPLGRNGHRSSIGTGGGHVGRGLWGDPDAKLVNRQGQGATVAALAWRTARVMAQAGLSMHAHTRDHRSASGVNGGTDAPNRVIPQTFRKATTLGVSQSYPGLGAHCVYARGSIGTTTGLTLLAYSAPVGGTGALTNYNSSHAHNYCGPMAFLEGEAYLADAAVSQWNFNCHYLNWNNYSHDQLLYDWDATARRAARSIPFAASGSYGSMPDISTEHRALGWPLGLMASAYALRADAHPETPFIKNMVHNVNLFLSDSFGYYNSTDRTRGDAYSRYTMDGMTSPWMANWQGMAAYFVAGLFDFVADNARGMTGFEEAAFLSARRLIRVWPNSLYGGQSYRWLLCTDSTGNTSIPADEYGEFISVTFAGGIGTATLKVGDGAGPLPGMKFRNGDKLRFPLRNTNLSPQTFPTGVDNSTLYYLINVTSAENTANSTFQISTSPGGSAVSVGNGTVVCAITPQDFAITTLGPQGTRFWPSDDSYLPISLALFEQAVAAGHSDLDAGIIAAIRDFMAPKVASYGNFAAWNYSAESLA